MAEFVHNQGHVWNVLSRSIVERSYVFDGFPMLEIMSFK